MKMATVKENKSNYSDEDFKRARVASKLQETTGKIRTKYLLYIINKILILKLPTTPDNLKADNYIFGSIIKYLKVKTVRKPG